MSRVAGIDLRDHQVRAIFLRVAYRKLEFEAAGEELVSAHGSKEEALRSLITRLGGVDNQRVDTLVSTIEGSRSFVHLLSLPATAEKKLDELLPFELEAQLPIELDEIVYSFQLSPRGRGASAPLEVLTVSAPLTHVQTRIGEIAKACGREPDRVGASAVELGQLAQVTPLLRQSGPLVVLEIGQKTTDLCLLEGGLVRSARSLSVGAESFPHRAAAYVAQIRQSLSGFLGLTGRPIEKLVLTGEGVALTGLVPFLHEQLGLDVGEVIELPAFELDGIPPEFQGRLAPFSRALSAALHGARGKGFDLRKGELSFQRGYGFLKEKAPLLFGLFSAILISFLFSTWSESRALERERESLELGLQQISKSVLGEEVYEPEEALELLERVRKAKPEDPMPYSDAFLVAVALAETLPEDIRHDVEQFDFAKGKIKIRGLVSSTEEVQRLTKAFDEHRCIDKATVTKISQVVNSDRERYILEADVLCPEDPGAKKKPEAPAQKEAEAQP